MFGEVAGWVAAGAYVFSPYLVTNALQRGDLPETLAMALAPWCLLGLWRLARAPRSRRLSLPVLATAAVGYTHTLSFVWVFGLVCGFALLLLWAPPPPAEAGHMPSRARRAAFLALAIGLALLLASAYWLPAFAELGYVQTARLTPPSGHDYHVFLIPVSELLGVPRRIDPLMINQQLTDQRLPYSLALPAYLLALLTLLPRRERWPGRLAAILALGVLVPTALMLPQSVAIWELVRPLQGFQFPWRLLGPASLCLAVLAGAGLARAAWSRAASQWLAGGAVLVLGLWALTWNFVPKGDLPLPARLDVTALTPYELAAGHIGTTSNAEFLPLAVTHMPAAPPADGVERAGLPTGSRVDLLQRWPYGSQWHVVLPGPGRLVYDQFVFPGWRANLDRQPLGVSTQPGSGLIALDLPAGDHHLTIQLEATGLERLATVLALLAAAGCGLLAVLDRRNTAEASAAPTGAAWSVPVPVLLAVSVVLGVRVSVQGRNTIFYGTRLWPDGLVGASVPTVADFDDKMRLLGADADSLRVVSGRDLTFTLYWQALQKLDLYYSVTTVLLDQSGVRVTQNDIEHPGMVWTTTWPTDSYVADPHHMHLPAGLPPGTYSLQVGVYERDTLRPLNVSAPSANGGSILMPLAQVQVVRPSVAPRLADLPMDVRLAPPAPFGGLELLGYSALPASARVGDVVSVQLYWRAKSGGLADWRADIQLGTSTTDFPVSGSQPYPTSGWARGEIVRATYQLPVSVLLPGGSTPLAMQLATANSAQASPALPLGSIQITIPPHMDQAPPITHPQLAQFGPAIQLLGYDLVQSTEGIDLSLYWRSLAPAEANYTVFVHVLDQGGHVSAQADRPPLNGARPTRGWIPGEVLTDSLHLDWPLELASGTCTVSIGLYDPTSGARLPVGATDSLSLTNLTVHR